MIYNKFSLGGALRLAVIITIFGVFYFYQMRERTIWSVEQSFMFWPVKRVAVDHIYSLIGTHFFSLTEGPVYRPPYFDWLVGSLGRMVGFSVDYLNYLFAGVALAAVLIFWRGVEYFGGKRVGFLAGFFLVSAWFVRVEAMTLWNVAWMVFLMSGIVYLLFKKKSAFLLGLFTGFGFSFHLVAFWVVASIVIYWLIFERKGFLRRFIYFVSGLILALTPLIVFNFRHNFLMEKGIVNMFTGNAPGYKATLNERLEIVWRTGNLLTGGYLPGLGLIFIAAWWRSRESVRRFVGFSFIAVIITFSGIFASGRKDFSNLHYGIHLLPLFIGLLAIIVNKLFQLKYHLAVFVVLVFYLYINFNQFYFYRVSNGYTDKLSLAKFILSQPGKKTVKFMDTDVLNYDGVFYEAEREMKLPEGDVSLLERWNNDEANIVVYSDKVVLVNK